MNSWGYSSPPLRCREHKEIAEWSLCTLWHQRWTVCLCSGAIVQGEMLSPVLCEALLWKVSKWAATEKWYPIKKVYKPGSRINRQIRIDCQRKRDTSLKTRFKRSRRTCKEIQILHSAWFLALKPHDFFFLFKNWIDEVQVITHYRCLHQCLGRSSGRIY